MLVFNKRNLKPLRWRSLNQRRVTAPYPSIKLGLLCWLDFENNLLDSHSTHRDFNAAGGAEFTAAGKINFGFDANGNPTAYRDDKTLMLMDSDGAKTDFACSFWFKKNWVVDGATIISQGQNVGTSVWKMWYENGVGLNITIDSTTVNMFDPFGDWDFIYLEYEKDINAWRYSVNGIPAVEITVAPVTPFGNFTIIGSNNTGSGVGHYDSVAFWNRKLTLTERIALYNLGAGKSYSQL